MTEIARTHAGGDDQEIVFECLNAQSRANRLNCASSQIDAFNLGQQNAEVLLLCFKLTDRRRNLRSRQNRCRDLIQERLKNMAVTPVDQQNLDIRSLEFAGSRHALKTSIH